MNRIYILTNLSNTQENTGILFARVCIQTIILPTVHTDLSRNSYPTAFGFSADGKHFENGAF